MLSETPKQDFSNRLRHMAETTIAVSGDWIVRYDHDCYGVWFYGNLHGWFETEEQALAVIPEYRRGSVRKQIARIMHVQQTLRV